MYTTIVHYFSKIFYSPRDAFSLSVESVSALDLFWQVAKDTVDGRSPVKRQIEQYKLNSHLGGFTYLFYVQPQKTEKLIQFDEHAFRVETTN